MLRSDDTTLSIVWRPPVGLWDGFTVVLRGAESATTVAQRILPWESRECNFNLLTPGRSYNITVVTKSGNLSNWVSVTARTGIDDHSLKQAHLVPANVLATKCSGPLLSLSHPPSSWSGLQSACVQPGYGGHSSGEVGTGCRRCGLVSGASGSRQHHHQECELKSQRYHHQLPVPETRSLVQDGPD